MTAISGQSPAEQTRAFVKTYQQHRLAEIRGVHLFPDRIIRLPKFGNRVKSPDAQWLAGVSARVESGTTMSIGALHSSVPGGVTATGGRARPEELWLVVDGPTFQWQVRLPPRYAGRSRSFIEALNSAARRCTPPRP